MIIGSSGLVRWLRSWLRWISGLVVGEWWLWNCCSSVGWVMLVRLLICLRLRWCSISRILLLSCSVVVGKGVSWVVMFLFVNRIVWLVLWCVKV